MAVSNTRQRAKELVQQIAKDHGYLGEEKLRTIEPELRREIEEAFLKKDQMIGSSVITLAKNLYTSKARFVFELLQNADDNYYTKAAALSEAPYVSFRVFPHQIVMECNEDGFTDKNLEAICSVGKSSKTGSQGYIGEKGIGFKSVFMAAWKAHIQSGAFSFIFSHRNGESGMGMISPIWEEPEEQQDLLFTRLTLHLHDTGHSDILEKTHQSIQQQFLELQETILLFMKNLRTIRVAFHALDGAEESSVEYSIERPEVNHAVLTRTVAKDGTEKEYIKHYHVTIHQATDVPRHENRTYAGQGDHTSEVVLAFPLSETSVPIIKPQDIFVYLPVRPVGFKFIIHADFVTDASRQDIVKDSLRNIALLDGIADAFARAVLQFCDHEGLRLQWMRYLPDRNDKNWGDLWLSLVNKIASRLSRTPVLYCDKKNDRHLINDLVRLTAWDCENGEPLFEDGDPEIIISQRYSDSDLTILKQYGLNFANFGHNLKWLAQDLDRGTQSRMRSAATTASWHTQTAKLLHLPFSRDWNCKAKLKSMALLPLEGGAWVSATTGPVFFSRIDGIDIPPNLWLRIIDKNITDTHRRTLFEDLGVQEAPISLVRRRILEIYEQAWRMPDMSVQTSKQHLTFLYRTQHLRCADEQSYSKLVLFGEVACIWSPSHKVVYMATDRSPYSPWELLKGSSSLSGYNTPGFMEHHFLHNEYFLSPPETPTSQTLTWVEWFHTYLGVEKYVYFGDKHLSHAAKYLQRYRPERFLGALQIHHQHNPDLSPDFIACVQTEEVLCRGGQKILLKDTYFPTKRLESLFERFMEHDTPFPLIWLEGETSYDTIPENWDRLLRKVGVEIPLSDLEFALKMLLYNALSLQSDCNPARRNKLFNLYSYIHSQYQAEGGTSGTEIRKLFKDHKLICIPLADSNTWVSPGDCVWGAIQELNTKFSLQIHYESLPFLDDDSKRDLKHLFSGTLGISDCTLENYIEELKSLQDDRSEDSKTINVLYEEIYKLWRMQSTQGMSLNWLKTQFEDHALVYVACKDGRSWRKPSQCVWSVAAQLRDKVSLNTEYKDLRDFFVHLLGVKSVTLDMAINKLKEADDRALVSVEEVKESLLMVSSLLCSEQEAGQQLRPTKKSRMFPVRYPGGNVRCESAQTEFFIFNRESLRSSFEGRVKFLDFDLEEVNRLRPLLSWARVEDKYVTRCMRVISSVQDSDAQPIFKPGREIQHRAHALLRIAHHYQSPRVETEGSDVVYERLRNAKILTTDRVSQILSLSQDGKSHEAQGDSIGIHLSEEGPTLKVYLPRNQDHQDYAFNMSLPKAILDWLMTDTVSQICKGTSEEAINAATKVWNTPLSLLPKALDESGISRINTPDLYAHAEEYSYDIGSPGNDDLEEVGFSPSAPEKVNHGVPENRSSGSFTCFGTDNESDTLPVRLAAPRASRASISSKEFLTPDPYDMHYVRVLGMVIDSARTGRIPDRNEIQTDIAWKGNSNIYGSTQFERDCKVSAAGELFVFELLSHVHPELPNFSRANWQSNMRNYVKAHLAAYATMDPWLGRGTSEITYKDTEGVLTDLLVRTHYLDSDRWTGRTPQYFIEVKTTTSACDTPFVMSSFQYERMRDANLAQESTDVIYLIFRVYQLDQGDQGPGLKIYMDPDALRFSMQLDFTAQGWWVVPR